MASTGSFRVKAVAIAGLALVAGTAEAADLLPTHKSPPPPAVAPAPSWTGFYIGVEGGVDWMHNSWLTTGLAPGFTPDGTAGAKFDQTGGRVGGYAGYNYQFAPTWVVGVEGEVAGDFFSSSRKSGIPGTLTFLAPPPFSDSISVGQSTYDASLRLRLGYLVTPSTLLYGTGGAAFSDPKTTINCPGPAAANSWCSAPESGSLSPERVGFTVGGGVEQMFWNNWTVRADYRFDRFEDKNLIFFPGAGVAGSDLIAVRSKVYTNTFDVGVAYRF